MLNKRIITLLILMFLWVSLSLVACGGGTSDGGGGSAEGDNPLSVEQPYAVAILEVQTATEYPGDGGEQQTAADGRQFALIKIASEAYSASGFSPGDLEYYGELGGERLFQAWAHQDKLTYDVTRTNQYGNTLGNGWLVFDVPAGTTAMDLVITMPDNGLEVEFQRRPIELP